jgi:hypothetical protein
MVESQFRVSDPKAEPVDLVAKLKILGAHVREALGVILSLAFEQGVIIFLHVMGLYWKVGEAA